MKIKQDGGPILTPNNLPGRTPVQIMITGSDCEVEATKKPRKQRKDPLKESRRQEKNLVNVATTGAGKKKHNEGSYVFWITLYYVAVYSSNNR